MGDECELIVRTARVWVPLLKTFLENEFSKSNANDKWFKNISAPLRINDDEIILWEHFETLWDTVTACSQKVEMWKNENNFETPKKKNLQFFGNQWLKCYETGSFPFYLHIVLCHTIYVFEKYKSLLLIQNQSSESTHPYNRQIRDAISTKKGFGKKISPSAEVLLYRCRIMCYEDIPLMEKDLEPLLTNALRKWTDLTNPVKNPRKSDSQQNLT